MSLEALRDGSRAQLEHKVEKRFGHGRSACHNCCPRRGSRGEATAGSLSSVAVISQTSVGRFIREILAAQQTRHDGESKEYTPQGDEVETPPAGLSMITSPCLVVGSATTSTTTTAPPNRSLTTRTSQRRSRKVFASRKSRLALTIDADAPATGDASFTTGQSTPASTSSSCSSDVVPWWEVEYQCPPPGHLGAHVVPVSVDDQVDRATLSPTANANPTTTTTAVTADVQVQVETPTQPIGSPNRKSDSIRPALVPFETPERVRRPYNKLKTLASTSCLLVDSSPSQKRKMRSLDPTTSETELFSTHVTKELKRFHSSSCSSLKARLQGQRVVTPSTLVQPLTEIGISRVLRPTAETPGPVSERNVA